MSERRLVVLQERRARATDAAALGRALGTPVSFGAAPAANDVLLLLAPGAALDSRGVSTALQRLEGPGAPAAVLQLDAGDAPSASLPLDLVTRPERARALLLGARAARACDASATPLGPLAVARAATSVSCGLEVVRAARPLALGGDEARADAGDRDACAIEGMRSFALEDLYPELRALRSPTAAPDALLDLASRLIEAGARSAAFALADRAERLRRNRDRGLPLETGVRSVPAPRDAPAPSGLLRAPPADPLVSVIVPTHDRPALLGRALASLADQTFADLEVIVVDDAGSDPSGVIEPWRGAIGGGGRTSLVRHDRNRGLAAARNTGLRLARGRYVCFLDDDDCLLPHHFAALLPALRLGARVVHADACVLDEEAAEPLPLTRPARQYYQQGYDPRLFLIENSIPVQAVLAERDLLREVGEFDEELPVMEDWDFWIRVFERSQPRHVPRVTSEVRSRVDGSNMSCRARGRWVEVQAAIYGKTLEHEARDPSLRLARLVFLREQAQRFGVAFPAGATLWLSGAGRVPPVELRTEEEKTAWAPSSSLAAAS